MNGIDNHTIAIDQIPLILAVDRGGRPSQWIDWKRASAYYLSEHVLWTYGDPIVTLRGGTNRYGERSTLAMHPIVAVHGADASRFEDQTIALDNRALFARDRGVLPCIIVNVAERQRRGTADRRACCSQGCFHPSTHRILLLPAPAGLWPHHSCAPFHATTSTARSTPRVVVR